MKKRLFSVVLALALCMGLAVPAFAAEPEFVIENGVLTKYNGPGGNVAIPDGVTGIWANVFQNCTALTGVIIPDSVTKIGVAAFWGCTSLTSVTIPDSVTKVGPSAFTGCTGLTDVKLPNGLTEIEDGLFSFCTGLVRVKIPDRVKEIGDHAFYGCNSIGRVTIPNCVTEIGEYAFAKCTSLSNIDISKNVTEIPKRMFDECLSLDSVTIPNGVTKIGDSAFCRCRSLYSATIPDSVVEIDDWAFGFCSNLENIYYDGTKEQWATIDIGEENEPLLNAAIHYDATPTHPAFTDVPSWCASSVTWAAQSGITDGVGNNRFAPGNPCTHEQILTFLYRAARDGGTASAEDMGKAVEWARDKGMIGASFDPKAACTRADAVTYIWQAFGKEDAPAGSFVDVPAGADYAAAVNWAAANGITNGYKVGDGSFEFRPKKTCNRGEIVTFLQRAYVPGVRLK